MDQRTEYLMDLELLDMNESQCNRWKYFDAMLDIRSTLPLAESCPPHLETNAVSISICLAQPKARLRFVQRSTVYRYC